MASLLMILESLLFCFCLTISWCRWLNCSRFQATNFNSIDYDFLIDCLSYIFRYQPDVHNCNRWTFFWHGNEEKFHFQPEMLLSFKIAMWAKNIICEYSGESQICLPLLFSFRKSFSWSGDFLGGCSYRSKSTVQPVIFFFFNWWKWGGSSIHVFMLL